MKIDWILSLFLCLTSRPATRSLEAHAQKRPDAETIAEGRELAVEVHTAHAASVNDRIDKHSLLLLCAS